MIVKSGEISGKMVVNSVTTVVTSSAKLYDDKILANSGKMMV